MTLREAFAFTENIPRPWIARPEVPTVQSRLGPGRGGGFVAAGRRFPAALPGAAPAVWERMQRDKPSSPSGPVARDPLFEEFRRGSPRAIARVAAMVQRVIRFRTFYVPEEERGDLVQEVMLHVWQAVTVREGIAHTNFDAFVRSVAYRRCVDWVRKRLQKLPSLPPAPPEDLAEDALLRREEGELAREVLRELRPACRELIRLHAGLHLTYREIAASQGRTEAAVRTQMCACLAEARRSLARLLRGRVAGGSEGFPREA